MPGKGMHLRTRSGKLDRLKVKLKQNGMIIQHSEALHVYQWSYA